mmetsp:Transcript_2112/g.5020  ORF Transcript_2112/g.5020 Transcript_2112/m.5020 type:complete len:248 (-) Transcript_2112:132-875(-)
MGSPHPSGAELARLLILGFLALVLEKQLVEEEQRAEEPRLALRVRALGEDELKLVGVGEHLRPQPRPYLHDLPHLLAGDVLRAFWVDVEGDAHVAHTLRPAVHEHPVPARRLGEHVLDVALRVGDLELRHEAEEFLDRLADRHAVRVLVLHLLVAAALEWCEWGPQGTLVLGDGGPLRAVPLPHRHAPRMAHRAEETQKQGRLLERVHHIALLLLHGRDLELGFSLAPEQLLEPPAPGLLHEEVGVR